jgi:hypothetical protein
MDRKYLSFFLEKIAQTSTKINNNIDEEHNYPYEIGQFIKRIEYLYSKFQRREYPNLICMDRLIINIYQLYNSKNCYYFMMTPILNNKILQKIFVNYRFLLKRNKMVLVNENDIHYCIKQRDDDILIYGYEDNKLVFLEKKCLNISDSCIIIRSKPSFNFIQIKGLNQNHLLAKFFNRFDLSNFTMKIDISYKIPYELSQCPSYIRSLINYIERAFRRYHNGSTQRLIIDVNQMKGYYCNYFSLITPILNDKIIRKLFPNPQFFEVNYQDILFFIREENENFSIYGYRNEKLDFLVKDFFTNMDSFIIIKDSMQYTSNLFMDVELDIEDMEANDDHEYIESYLDINNEMIIKFLESYK